MPASAVERPSIALGLLKTLLEAQGVPAQVMYANLWFLDYCGRDDYQLLDRFRPEEAVVDWAFGEVAFPGFKPDHARFAERLASRNGLDPAIIARLHELRMQMPAFVDWVAGRVVARRPRIVGCTSTFQQHVASLALLRRIKELQPEIVTVIGGANCESVMGRTTHQHFTWVDYVVSGEADAFVAPLFQAMLSHGRDIPLAELPFGVFAPGHREAGYPTAQSGDGVPRAITEDIRTLPLPDYTDYFAELERCTYADAIMAGLPMEFSRGCWWGQRSHCTFCGLNGGSMNFRAKSPDVVAGEMRTMASRYGTRRIEAVDNIMDLSYFDTVLPDLATRPGELSVFFETKSNLKRRHVELLAQAGVRWIQPGIESLHSGVLTLMRKGASAWTNVQLLKWARQHGVRMSWSMICGFPGEADEWYSAMAEYLPALTHLQPGPAIALRYDRYSPYFTNPAQHGLTLRPAEMYQYAYPLPPDALFDQVYFFESADSPVEPANVTGLQRADRPGLTAVRMELERWNRAWQGPKLPQLMLRAAEGKVVVDDTRPFNTQGAPRVLDELEQAVLLQADDAPPEAKLRETMLAAGFDGNALENVLSRLEADRLVLRLDGRVISLPLREPCAPLPASHAFPGGFFADVPSVLSRLLAAAG
jgi:ribosomal peptide maturation radical SAM protein 1